MYERQLRAWRAVTVDDVAGSIGTFRKDHIHYKPTQPTFLGSRIIQSIPLKEVIPYINWLAFIAAWRIPLQKYKKKLDFPEIEKLTGEAKMLLEQWSQKENLIRAIIGFYPVTIEDGSILVEGEKIPFLRQQEKKETDVYKSLIDFIHPEGDYVGFFTISVEGGMDKEDDYQDILAQLLRDRLVEAAAEYLHEKVRKEYWGYAPEESYTPEELLKAPYVGIRPASGYPVHPDLSLNFIIDRLLEMEKIGVSLTSNAALSPTSTVAGMYIAHPDAVYFRLGKIDEEQLLGYAKKKNITENEAKKWLNF